MNVVVLSRMFPNAVDPANGIFVLEQIRAMRRLGVAISVIAPIPWTPPLANYIPRFSKYRSVPPQETVDGFTVHHPQVPVLPRSKLFSVYGVLTYLQCRRYVKDLLRRSRVDIIHAHAVLPDGHAAALLVREFGIPVVCTAHGSDVSDYPFRSRAAMWAARFAIRGVDRFITVNADLKGRIRELGGNCPVSVVYNGADENVFSPIPKMAARRALGIPERQKILVFVGYLCKEKGIGFLLAAMKQMRVSECVLYLVGDGDLRDSLKRESETLGVANRCIFVGKRPHTEVPQWLCAADCFILPSITEGFPLVIVEALFCRVPAVATRVGGIPEIIHDGETGVLVPPQDPCSLARAIDTVMSDSGLATRIVERAASLVQSRFTWTANAEQTVAVFEKTLMDSRAGRRSTGTQKVSDAA